MASPDLEVAKGPLFLGLSPGQSVTTGWCHTQTTDTAPLQYSRRPLASHDVSLAPLLRRLHVVLSVHRDV
jgi:hypothetical protein